MHYHPVFLFFNHDVIKNMIFSIFKYKYVYILILYFRIFYICRTYTIKKSRV